MLLLILHGGLRPPHQTGHSSQSERITCRAADKHQHKKQLLAGKALGAFNTERMIHKQHVWMRLLMQQQWYTSSVLTCKVEGQRADM
jgi:hypothetical protein